MRNTREANSMTAYREARPGSGAPATAPVIVLTYGFAGGRKMLDLLEREPDLACTTGTGILPACSALADAWSQAEDRQGKPVSALAASSIRSVVGGMLTIIIARTGRRRWCETAAAEPAAAETFLTVFPETRFLCLHRACPDVVYAAVKASPWGVSGPGFAAHLAAQPSSTAAALAAWWAGHAGWVAEFENRNPQACMRVRYEDLALSPGSTASAIRDFLGLAPGPDDGGIPGPGGQPPTGADAPGCGADFPVGQLPPRLVDQVNALHERLGYPPLSSTSRS